MKLKCIKCEKIKELSSEELKEVGEFVLGRKLRAVGFLKFLSLDMRELCEDGKNHEWEFESEFDKEVHQLSTHLVETRKIKEDIMNKIDEYEESIKEYQEKIEVGKKKNEECASLIEGDKEKLRNIVYIDDPGMWSDKEVV